MTWPRAALYDHRMSATPSAPFFKRLPPGRWAAVAWGAGIAFTALLRISVPGQEGPDVMPGFVILRWDGLLMLAVATLLTLRGSALLARRPTAALNHLLVASVIASTPSASPPSPSPSTSRSTSLSTPSPRPAPAARPGGHSCSPSA